MCLFPGGGSVWVNTSYYLILHLYKWHVCLGSYILEQEEGRDMRKKGRGGGQGGGHGIR